MLILCFFLYRYIFNQIKNIQMSILKKLLFSFFGISISFYSHAGNQQYELLKDETRTLMSQSVADTPPKFSSFDNPLEEKMWLSHMSERLSRSIKDEHERVLLLKTIHYEATRAGLDPILILGLMKIESGFKKYAFSSVGARGYMQVMPFWVDLIGDKKQNLFYMRTNLRYGCTILKHYLEIERGNLFMALGRYNGSRGKSEYPNAVFGAMKQFKYEG